MKILAIEIEVPGKSAEDFKPYLKDEAKHVLDLKNQGVIKEIYFDETHCAVLLIEAASKKTAEAILSEFPLVKANLIRFEARELHPYDGFERLD